MELLHRVKKIARDRGLIAPGDRILVAVSGGPDSLALLHLLHQLSDDFALHLEVAHLQHGIRGEEAMADARLVADLAASFGLPFHLKEISLPLMLAQARRGNLEGLARAERYRFFAEVAGQRKLAKVATAHTEDDQAETMLMWFLRGAGRKGLGGISPVRILTSNEGSDSNGIAVIRPLLEVSKAEILQFLNQRQLRFRVDSTNRDSKLLRNWIRLELLPQLGARLDGAISSRLADQGKLWRDEQALLDGLAREAVEKCRRDGALDRGVFLQQPIALQRLMLRHWIGQARGNLLGLDFIHVEMLLNLVSAGPSQGRLAIPGGWELVREYQRLFLKKCSRRTKRLCYVCDFTPGELLRIPEAGVELHSELLSDGRAPRPIDLMEAQFDLDRLPPGLTVRNFRNGDRFSPLGMAGHKKVKDLFIEKKLPLSLRASLPMLAGGGEILWIPGCGRSPVALVTPASRSVVRIKAVRTGT